MSNVGRSAAGNTLIGQGVTNGPRFAAIGTDSGLTANGLVVAHGTSPFTATAAATNGQVIIGSTGAAPAFGSITSSGGTITFTPGPNSLNMEAGASVPTTVTGDSGTATPVANNLNIKGLSGSKTSGSGSTLTVKSPPFSQVGSSATSSLNTGEFVTAAVTRTLPASAGLADGDLIIYSCTTAGALVIQAVGTQKIRLGSLLSSAAGSLTSTAIGDSVTLRFDATQGFWMAVSSIGTWTIA